ncbi:membrane protein insertase YidC [Oharaeibacter diazotrophicus]|uniref:Membrane protein insertase YidC n=2 Tax=Oharaeibacter diazotrophicus TaxID=1920512 RepID=A0A4R6RDV7_9HYPH|nr:membrane protein insertase YidC [Oharaeibacter diazotrophicus]TDP83907.1 YidC/Oxa1 family membrane protein insertase [Oharaeibacter diazotrophicus]BBE72949.1 membrane protein insertase YidC [Pleomorphomonas sp. SM30]GLS74728.1 membrane protein insertase YidC [Oharaeibacter diazotrophicus]
MADNRNMFLAILLSLVVLLGWQYFVAAPQVEKARQAEQARQAQASNAPAPAASGAAATSGSAAPAGAAATAATAQAASRDEALARDARVPIDTPEIAGSVNLKGGRIDDVALKAYTETVDPTSPAVKLLNPLGGPDAYYAEFGFAAAAGDPTPVPNGDTVWTAPAGAKLTPSTPLTLTYDNGKGLVFTRTIAVDEHAMFEVKDAVANTGAAAATLYPYGFVVRHGTPHTQGTYVLHEGLLGVFDGHGVTEVKYSTLASDGALKPDAAKTGWLGITDKYWAAALIPAGEAGFQPRFLHSKAGETDVYQADYLRDALTVAPGASAGTDVRLFAGAKTVARIDAYEAEYGITNFDRLIDWGWFYWLTKPMFRLIDFLYKVFGNFGLAILGVTVIVKAVFFPLANKSYASMSKMKKVQPEMAALRERYADDKMKQQQELMALYKKEKINPLAGCLPVLIQIPVFFSLYKVLYVTIEMRHAPFYGWIHDLSAPDPTSLFTLFGLIPWTPPHMLMIGIWPLIMGVTMFVQMKLNPAPPDPTQAAIFTWMPVIFTFMLGSFPAGLVIYWAWNNTLSILQQSLIMKRHGVKIELFDNLKSTFAKKPAGG